MSYRTPRQHLLRAWSRTVGRLALLTLSAAACSSDDDGSTAALIQQGTTINLADGTVQGEVDGRTRRFLGIPFAAPPVGTLRWRPPQPPAPWQGVRAANAFGSPCPQTPSINGTPSQDEDCLYLNVWTPDPAPARPLPVMVWFHGGGNQSGSAGDLIPLGLGGLFYNGRVLAETRNVIVVTTNYRLGVFGFFGLSALAAEDPHYPYAGNQGLLDQRAALEWVRDNIIAFGGDSDNVTVFGESAGSFDVCFHVVSPGSRGLFHRAISESGGCTTHQDGMADAETAAEGVSAAVGCAASADVLPCLRQVPVATLLNAGASSFNPIVDGGFLPDQPRALFAAGSFSRVPYILGSNSDEGTLFFIGVRPVTTQDEYLAALRDQFGDLADQVADVYPADSFASPQAALVRAFGDAILVCPTYDSARRAAAGGADVYLYNFARPIPLPQLAGLHLGATHGAEIAYVFGSVDPPTEIDRQIAAAMQGYWTRLAASGDPNGGDAVVWPRYADASDERLNLDAEISAVSGFRRTECEFWWGVYDQEFP
jgi:para-nitrobenzyl esterase